MAERHIRSVTVYCGASSKVAPQYIDLARRLGTFLGKNGIELYFGAGSKGLMGAVAQASLEEGGKVHGIGFKNDYLKETEPPLEGLTSLVIAETIHQRKEILHTSSDLIIVLPGGLGTLDEMVESLTWQYLGIHKRPMLIINLEGFWDPFLMLFEHLLREKFIKDDSRYVKTVVNTLEDAITYLDRLRVEEALLAV